MNLGRRRPLKKNSCMQTAKNTVSTGHHRSPGRPRLAGRHRQRLRPSYALYTEDGLGYSRDALGQRRWDKFAKATEQTPKTYWCKAGARAGAEAAPWHVLRHGF